MKKRNQVCFFAVSLFLGVMPFASYSQSPNPPESVLDNPVHAQSDVLPIYSDAYTVSLDMPVLNGTEAKEIEIDGNKIWHVKIGSGSSACFMKFDKPLDLSAYNTLFIDVYAVEANPFNFRIRLNGAEGSQQLQLQVKTGWNRLEYDLNDFYLLDKVPNLKEVTQINFVGEGARTVFLDNIYACKTPYSALEVIPTTPAPSTTQKASDVLPIFTDLYPNEVGAKLDNATVGNPAAIKSLSYNGKSDKMIFVKGGKTGNGGLNFNSAVDITGYDSIHFDIYPINSTIPMRVKIAGISNQGTLVTAGTQDAWNAMDIALTDWEAALKDTDNPDLMNVQNGGFWLFQATGYERTFFLDNVFFYKTRTEESTGPATGLDAATMQNLVSVTTEGHSVMLSSETPMNAIQVYSLSGQHVIALQDAGCTATVDLPSEQSGIYLIKVLLADGETVTKKILNM